MIRNKKELQEYIEECLQISKLSPTAFGKAVIGAPNLVFDIRNGRFCGEKIQESIEKFMSAYTGGEVQPNDFYKGDE